MSYVVYHINSTKIIKSFNEESSAKRSATCMNRNAYCSGESKQQYAFTSDKDYYANVVFTKKVTSLMTGEEVVIASNTPHCCDPSAETYWSM